MNKLFLSGIAISVVTVPALMSKLFLSGVAISLVTVPALAQMAHPDPAPQTRAAAEAKVRTHFGMLDGNKDGTVTREEIMASVDARMTKHRGEAFDTLDTDKNGSLSREEFAARGAGHKRIVMRMRDGSGADHAEGAMPGHGGHKMLMRRHGGKGGGMMMMHTEMGADGRISIDEMVKARLARFDQADTNKDGTLTPDERKAARAARREMRIEMRGKPAS